MKKIKSYGTTTQNSMNIFTGHTMTLKTAGLHLDLKSTSAVQFDPDQEGQTACPFLRSPPGHWAAWEVCVQPDARLLLVPSSVLSSYIF